MSEVEQTSSGKAQCQCVHITSGFCLSDTTGLSSHFKLETQTHCTNTALFALQVNFCVLKTENWVFPNRISGQRSTERQQVKEYDEVLILIWGTNSYAQDTKAAAKTWRESRFVTWECHIYGFLVMWYSHNGLTVPSVIVRFALVYDWKDNEKETQSFRCKHDRKMRQWIKAAVHRNPLCPCNVRVLWWKSQTDLFVCLWKKCGCDLSDSLSPKVTGQGHQMRDVCPRGDKSRQCVWAETEGEKSQPQSAPSFILPHVHLHKPTIRLNIFRTGSHVLRQWSKRKWSTFPLGVCSAWPLCSKASDMDRPHAAAQTWFKSAEAAGAPTSSSCRVPLTSFLLSGRSAPSARARGLAEVVSFTQTHSRRIGFHVCPEGAEKAPVVEMKTREFQVCMYVTGAGCVPVSNSICYLCCLGQGFTRGHRILWRSGKTNPSLTSDLKETLFRWVLHHSFFGLILSDQVNSANSFHMGK